MARNAVTYPSPYAGIGIISALPISGMVVRLYKCVARFDGDS